MQVLTTQRAKSVTPKHKLNAKAVDSTVNCWDNTLTATLNGNQMKYLYAFIVAFIWSIPALAQNAIDTSNLPRKQQAEVALLAAQLAVGKTDAASTRESNVKASNSLADWANVGSSIGQAFGSAAKEVGIAINDFANSPVGRVAMALIVWHFIGGALIHFIGGLFVIIIGLSFIVWLVKRTYPTTYQYDKNTSYA